jgi:N-acetyltransferase 10
LELLSEYYEGKFINLNENNNDDNTKKKLPPLLSKLTDVKPNCICCLGTSFGLTQRLYSFWKKNGYKPLYIKLTPNNITGEHSCKMIKPIRE